MNYLYLSIPLVSLFVVFWFNLKSKKNILNISSVLIFTYLFMAASAILYQYFSSIFYYNHGEIDLTAVVYFTILISLYVASLSAFDEDKIKEIVIPHYRVFYILCWIFVIFSFLAIIHFIPACVEALKGDIGRNRILQVQGEKFVRLGIINTISGTIATFYPITLLMFFVSFLKGNKTLSVCLFISSLSYVFFVLAYVGRDGFLFWLSMFLFYYLLFRKFLTVRQKKIIKRYGWVLGTIFATGFTIITISRFGDRGYPVVLNIVDYMGQQIKNFSDVYNVDLYVAKGQYNFNLIYSFFDYFSLENPQNDVEQIIEQDLGNYGVRNNIFGTFLKNFYYDFGKGGTIIITFVYVLLVKFITKRKINISIGRIILYMLFYQIVFHGVFYLRLSNDVGNLYIIVTLLIGLFFFTKSSSKDKIVLRS